MDCGWEGGALITERLNVTSLLYFPCGGVDMGVSGIVSPTLRGLPPTSHRPGVLAVQGETHLTDDCSTGIQTTNLDLS